MEKQKLGNVKQIISAYQMQMQNGSGAGKRFVLVTNGALEVAFNADNALDIAWVKYHGQNISFLSKVGFNSNVGAFRQKFEGGFLYTCGIDNVSGCEQDKIIHGSLHHKKAENVSVKTDDEKVEVSATVVNSYLFGENLVMQRNYVVYSDKIEVHDSIKNKGFAPADYVLLYHVNFGYPLLDKGMGLTFDEKQTIPANEKTKNTLHLAKVITDPVLGDSEDLYYHILNKGEVKLKNDKIGIEVDMQFSTKSFPYLVEWRNLVPGDYVLGIEPSTTRFDEYKKNTLAPDKTDNFDITFDFKKF